MRIVARASRKAIRIQFQHRKKITKETGKPFRDTHQTLILEVAVIQTYCAEVIAASAMMNGTD